jgi:prolyl 4-hydroxylase
MAIQKSPHTSVGKRKPDGTFEKAIGNGRTSTNAWCQNACYKDPIAERVMERLVNLTGIDETNSEFLQLLRYEPGQFYNSHHDYIRHDFNRRQGVRILTVYLYLNDVPAGGGTKFTDLNLTVMPKRGRALIWPSVLNEAPNEKDHRTHHEALATEEGVKYGANGWFHMRDFKTANREGCQ